MLVVDNNNTNRSFSQLVGNTFDGCHKHSFNLAVNDLISERKDVVDKKQVIMKKVSYSIEDALLQRLTPLSKMHRNLK